VKEGEIVDFGIQSIESKYLDEKHTYMYVPTYLHINNILTKVKERKMKRGWGKIRDTWTD
jgi:phage antirepressor YoqD-like protein